MYLDGLNLNLLVALDALLRVATMTEAADRLGLTQPALSRALKQLREYYGDPLILYAPGGPTLTPLAQRLAPVVHDMLATARGTRKLAASFAPETYKGELMIVASDWIELTVLKDLLVLLARESPGLQVRVHTRKPSSAAEAFREGADLVFTARPLISPEHSPHLLYTEDLVCIGWTGNPAVKGQKLDAESFFAARHVSLSESMRGPFEVLDAQRQVTIRTASHAALPHIVAGTDLLAVTTRRFAQEATRIWPVRMQELPFSMPPLAVHLQWPHWREHDGMLKWVRTRLYACINHDEAMI